MPYSCVIHQTRAQDTICSTEQLYFIMHTNQHGTYCTAASQLAHKQQPSVSSAHTESGYEQQHLRARSTTVNSGRCRVGSGQVRSGQVRGWGGLGWERVLFTRVANAMPRHTYMVHWHMLNPSTGCTVNTVYTIG